MDLTRTDLESELFVLEDLANQQPDLKIRLRNLFKSLYEKEKQMVELKNELIAHATKLTSQDNKITELRAKLQKTSGENLFFESSEGHKTDIKLLEQKKNELMDERESLFQIIDRQNIELERLRPEITSYHQQLKHAINEKCEVIALLDEVKCKEVSLDLKERYFQQERSLMNNQVKALSENLNSSILELQTLRRENTFQIIQLETRLTEKVEELKIVQSQCIQHKDTVEELTKNIQILSSKLLNKSEENNRIIDFYKNELEVKTKLAELYKSNCEDIDSERKELNVAVTELKHLLTEASLEYGKLETTLKSTVLKNKHELEEHKKKIEYLKVQINNANDLISEAKIETIESNVSHFSPSAATACRLFRSDICVTELYSLYLKNSEQLKKKNNENLQLDSQLKSILHELSEKVPLLREKELAYEKLIENHNKLLQERDKLLIKCSEVENKFSREKDAKVYIERENKKLKISRNDLSRQVCYLLKEIEQLRIGLVAETQPYLCGNISSTDEVISKNLTTFGNVNQLQENNQKLLLLVRDLSTKLETREIDLADRSYRNEIEIYKKKLNEMQDTLNHQNNSIAILLSKCEHYESIYSDTQNQSDAFVDKLNINRQLDIKTDLQESKSVQTTPSDARDAFIMDGSIGELTQCLNEMKDEYKTLTKQNQTFFHENVNNNKFINDKFDSMRNEISELISTNCKFMLALEHSKVQLRSLQKNMTTYKQKITMLEEEHKKNEITIYKYDQTIKLLKDEIVINSRARSTEIVERDQLRTENTVLKDALTNFHAKQDIVYHEHQNHSLLLNNIEAIKCYLEKKDSNDRCRLEHRLAETERELSVQKCRLQEERDRIRDLTSDFSRQNELLRKQLNEEKTQSQEKLSDFVVLKADLTKKTMLVNDLSQRLLANVLPVQADKATKSKEKNENLEIHIKTKPNVGFQKSEFFALKEQAKKYDQILNSEETDKNLRKAVCLFALKSEKEVKQKSSVEKPKAQIIELEIPQSMLSEASKTDDSNLVIKDILCNLTQCNHKLCLLNFENSCLRENLRSVEIKYANEMGLHSAAIKDLKKLEAEILKLQSQVNYLQHDRESFQLSYDELKNAHKNALCLLQEQNNISYHGFNFESQSRLHRANAWNSPSSGLPLIRKPEIQLVTINEMHKKNDSNSNDEFISTAQMVNVIQFLRTEKELYNVKLDIFKSENMRLISEHSLLQTQIDELNSYLTHERTKSELAILSNAKHERILKEIETLNAIADSNRTLRKERDILIINVKELKEALSSVETEFFVLSDQQKKCSLRIDEITLDNTSLRSEALKWRQRANILVEKNNNKNPEEFKRLQMERENLAKMLTGEKERLKQSAQEIESIKSEKNQLASQILTMESRLKLLEEEKKKLIDDLHCMKQNNSQICHSLMEVKNRFLQKEQELQQLKDELDCKESQLQESKNKEMQIRKIAKRYKDSFLELSTKKPMFENETIACTVPKKEGLDISVNSDSNISTQNVTTSVHLEVINLKKTVEALNIAIRNSEDSREKLQKELNDLKASADIDERTKTLLREAKAHIVSLTESKSLLTQELVSSNSKLDSLVTKCENYETALKSFKDSSKCIEIDNGEDHIQCKATIDRLTKDNESLSARINQLLRQIAVLGPSKKDQNNSVVVIDNKSTSECITPRTANVKPMSGPILAQQSATVTPWRSVTETPLASIRPLSVQSRCTAAIFPNNQQQVIVAEELSLPQTSNLSSNSNKVLVPQAQPLVHTTGGNTSPFESSSTLPTSSSQTEYSPSTSSAPIHVATISPLSSVSASAESSHITENESEANSCVSQPQQVVVALISPRIEGSVHSAQTQKIVDSETVPAIQLSSYESHTIKYPFKTTGTFLNRKVSSCSNVTTTQLPACSNAIQKRLREKGDSYLIDTFDGSTEASFTNSKRPKIPTNDFQIGSPDTEYQVPTSSQRDQDEIVSVDSEDERSVSYTKVMTHIFKDVDPFLENSDLVSNTSPQGNADEVVTNSKIMGFRRSKGTFKELEDLTKNVETSYSQIQAISSGSDLCNLRKTSSSENLTKNLIKDETLESMLMLQEGVCTETCPGESTNSDKII